MYRLAQNKPAFTDSPTSMAMLGAIAGGVAGLLNPMGRGPKGVARTVALTAAGGAAFGFIITVLRQPEPEAT